MQTKPELLRYLPELDGVRGIAVLLVMVMHFADPDIHALPHWMMSVLGNGAAGVDIFFVLSGFLITRILITSREAENYFSAFYVRRALRIFPLYFVVVFLFFDLCVPALQHFAHKLLWIRPTEQLWYWFFLANWRGALGYNDGAQLTHFWTLAIEEQFYIFWSVALWLLRPRSVRTFVIAVIVLSTGSRLLGVYLGTSGLLLGRGTFTRVDALALGGLLVCWPALRTTLAGWARWLLPLCCLLCLPALPIAVKFVFYDLGGACLIALAATRTLPWLRTPWLVLLGKYSFGLYVLHYLIHGLMAPLGAHVNPYLFTLLSVPVGIGLSFAAALASWRLLEQPFLRLKNRFPYRFAASAPASV